MLHLQRLGFQVAPYLSYNMTHLGCVAVGYHDEFPEHLSTRAPIFSVASRIPAILYFRNAGVPLCSASASSSSSSSTISFPFDPSVTHWLAMQAKIARHAKHQNPSPTTPILRPSPKIANAHTGNIDRLRLPITVAEVWIVPRTEGCGVQSLIRSVVAGVTPVRPMTKSSNTRLIATQTKAVRPSRDGAEATSAGKGARR